MENLLSKDKKKLRRQNPSMSIKDWLRDLSQENGHSQMMLKSGMSNLKMDLLTVNLGKIVPEHHARKDYL